MTKKALALSAIAALAVSNAASSSALAGAIPHQHILRHFRVDGTSDLRGRVRARSGLLVTAGLTTDTLNVSGPVQMGGTLTVVGGLTSNGLNAGAGSITSTGTLQGGSLTVGGDATVGGLLTVSRRVAANGVDVGAGGLNVASGLAAGSASVSGGLTAGSLSTAGALNAGSGTFHNLTVSPGGVINFNNAQITGLNGLNLTGNAAVNSIQITTSAAGGLGGAQAINVSQAGHTASLSVDTSGQFVIGGAGLSTSALTVADNATVNGKITTSEIDAPQRLTLNAPQVVTAHDLIVAGSNDLSLYTNGGNQAAHLFGNTDTRGSCQASATTGGVNTCSIGFHRAYGSAPFVTVTPSNAAPGLVTGYSVQSTTTGFVVYFTVSQPAIVTFNYMAEQ